MSTTIVRIPGELTATYVDGKIVDWTFMPHGSNAGYFGPTALVDSGDDELEVEDTDGPFWRAVQKHLDERFVGRAMFTVEWSE